MKGGFTRVSWGGLLACMLLLFASWAQAQGVSSRPFRAGFGVVTKFSQGQPAAQIDLLPQLGVSWVRDTELWPVIEPRAGDYKPFSPAFQARLKKYRQHGIGVVFMLAYANPGAYPKTFDQPLAPINPKAFGRFAAHVAQELSKAGVHFALEVWNEPHNFHIREMVGGEWNGRPPSPWVDHYMEMVSEVITQVRRTHPDVPVMTSEDVWSNHYWFARSARLPKGFRDIGLHPYANDTSTGPEVAAPHADTDWGKPFQMVDRDRSFESAVRRLREHTKAHTGVMPAVWLTEWGYRIGEKLAQGVLTEQMAAGLLVRSFVLAEAVGAEANFWFSMNDVSDGAYGLIDNAGKQRLTFRAFVQMNQLLGDHNYAGRMTPAERPTTQVQVHRFTKGPIQKLVVWSADNRNRKLKLEPSWDVRQVQDVLGRPVELSQSDGRRSVEVDGSPLYILLGPETKSVNWSDKYAE